MYHKSRQVLHKDLKISHLYSVMPPRTASIKAPPALLCNPQMPLEVWTVDLDSDRNLPVSLLRGALRGPL